MELKAILAALSATRDKDTRKTILIVISIPLIAILLIFILIVYILASPFAFLSPVLSSEEKSLVSEFKTENDSIVEGYVNLSSLGILAFPFDNPESVSITSPYGYRIHPISGKRKFHSGIDFGTPHHCNIYAVAMGEVTFAGVNGGYGNCVIIKHEVMGEKLYTLYAHLSQIGVRKGQTVMQGETIGIEGGSASDLNHGVSTGHHLHFEVRNKDYKTKNPKDYLGVK